MSWRPCIADRRSNENHYSDVILIAIASQITGVPIVYSTVCSGADRRKHQNSASLAFVRRIHRWPVNSPNKGSVTQKMFPFDDVIKMIPNIHWFLHCYTFRCLTSKDFISILYSPNIIFIPRILCLGVIYGSLKLNCEQSLSSRTTGLCSTGTSLLYISLLNQ